MLLCFAVSPLLIDFITNSSQSYVPCNICTADCLGKGILSAIIKHENQEQERRIQKPRTMNIQVCTATFYMSCCNKVSEYS